MLALQDLMKLKNCHVINKNVLQEKTFSGVSIDSRNCRRNELFFAIRGEKQDGHKFINDVFRKGSLAAVVDMKWYSQNSRRELNKNRAYAVVEDTTKALGELARNHRRKFLIPVLAVGGSNGKTTTRDMIAAVLSKKYNVLSTEQNLNNQYGVPLTLLRLKKDHNFCVIELGTNHFGEIKYLCSLAEPQFGVITNIAKEHLEFLRDLNGVARAEGELVDYIKKSLGTFFLNKDDSRIKKKIGRNFKHYFSYASGNKADVTGKIIRYNSFYPTVSVSCNKFEFKTTLSMIGTQSFDSALCAAAVGFYFEVLAEKIKNSLAGFKIATNRRNQLLKSNGFWIIDDSYNSNPDSVYTALNNLKNYKIKGETHIVLADMLELGKSSRIEHHKIGRMIRRMEFKNLYTYGPHSYETYRGAGGIENNFHFTDKQALIDLLKRRLKKNDLVFVKGSHSMRMDEVVDSIKD